MYEPTSGVNNSTREEIIGILNDLNVGGMTIVVIPMIYKELQKTSMDCVYQSSYQRKGRPEDALTENNLWKHMALRSELKLNLIGVNDRLNDGLTSSISGPVLQ